MRTSELKSLSSLKTTAVAWVEAEQRYKANPLSKRLEGEAQTAFGTFVGALDGRTVLSLIDALETAQHVADNFVWLAQNAVTTIREDSYGPARMGCEFYWPKNTNNPQTLGEAVRVAMQQKSAILRVPG